MANPNQGVEDLLKPLLAASMQQLVVLRQILAALQAQSGDTNLLARGLTPYPPAIISTEAK